MLKTRRSVGETTTSDAKLTIEMRDEWIMSDTGRVLLQLPIHIIIIRSISYDQQQQQESQELRQSQRHNDNDHECHKFLCSSFIT